MHHDLHTSQGVKTGPHVVKHNTYTFAKPFEVAKRRRLYDIEPAKKYKAQQQRFPRPWGADEGNELACDFVNYNKLRIFKGSGPADTGSSRYPDHDSQAGENPRRGGLPLRIEPARQEPPEEYSRGRGPSAWAGTDSADPEERSDQRSPQWSGAGRLRPTRRDAGTTVESFAGTILWDHLYFLQSR